MTPLLAVLTILTGVSANAQPLQFACEPIQGSGVEQTLQIDGSTLSVSSSDELNGMTFTATFDSTYKPKKGSQNIRFNGQEDGIKRSVIIYSKMQTGFRSGEIQIQGSEDGFWANNYYCVREK